MSKDFPNRDYWLSIRATPRKLNTGRYLHVSARLVSVIDPISKKLKTIAAPGVTLNMGRNKQKRAAKVKSAELREFDAEKIAQEAEAA